LQELSNDFPESHFFSAKAYPTNMWNNKFLYHFSGFLKVISHTSIIKSYVNQSICKRKFHKTHFLPTKIASRNALHLHQVQCLQIEIRTRNIETTRVSLPFSQFDCRFFLDCRTRAYIYYIFIEFRRYLKILRFVTMD